jgi:hypothetical protein
MYLQRNIVTSLLNQLYSGKAIDITYSQGLVVALVIQHAMPCACGFLSSMACQAVKYCFHIIS